MPTARNYRLHELDALRGLAAMMVVICHCTLLNPGFTFKYGGVGVDLFFIISGFVIFMTLNTVKTGREFIIKRFARLYPVYWVCLTLTMILMVCELYFRNTLPQPELWIDYAAGLTMLQRFVGRNDLDGPYWSLAVELVFYLLIFLTYKLRLLKYAVPIFLVLATLQFSAQLLLHLLPRTGFVGDLYSFESSVLFPHFISLFLAGIVFYRMYNGNKTVLNYLLIALCLIMQCFEHEGRHIEMFDMVPWEYNMMLSLFFSLFILFINGKLRFIVNHATLFLGRISYALYLFHQYLLIRFLIPFLNIELKLSYLLSCIIAITIVAAIATVNTFFIDEPLRKRIMAALLKKEIPEISS